MKKLLLPLAVALPFAQVGLADYQAELGYSYTEAKSSESDNEINADTLSGKVFFEAVDTSKGPYAESAFLSQSSYLYIQHNDADAKNGALDGDTVLNYGAHAVLDGGWIVGAEVSDSGDSRINNVGGTFLPTQGDSVKTISIKGGLYLDESSSVTLTYSNVDNDMPDADADGYNLNYQNFIGNNDGGGLKLESNLAYWDDDSFGDVISLDASADYYIDKHFSIGFNGGYADLKAGGEVFSYGVKAQFYFNDKLGIFFDYHETDYSDTALENQDIWTAGVNVRF